MRRLFIIIVLSTRINLSSDLDAEPEIVHTPVGLRYPSSETWGLQMTMIPARIIRALVLTGLLCLSSLVTSCAHLEKIADDLFSNRWLPQEDHAGKRIPLPPTVKDFESDLPDS